MGYNIGIVGASGMVGKKVLEVLAEENIDIKNLYLYSSKKSAGEKVEFLNKNYEILELKQENFINKKIDYALFCAGGGVSKEYIPLFVNQNIVVIDNSSAFRMEKGVPLIVPEVNGKDIGKRDMIIANPNCSTIQAVMALAPLHKKYKIKRVVFSTYQSVSGAGIKGIKDLQNGVKGIAPTNFVAPIFNNLIPQIDVFLPDGYTKEEEKMIKETRKILKSPAMKITATTVRVPVENCHSESINVEFEKPFNIIDVKNILSKSKGIIVMDDPSNLRYPTPLIANDKNDVFIGRLRRDESVKHGLNMWVVADNLRKGAATNAVQILKYIVDNK